MLALVEPPILQCNGILDIFERAYCSPTNRGKHATSLSLRGEHGRFSRRDGQSALEFKCTFGKLDLSPAEARSAEAGLSSNQ